MKIMKIVLTELEDLAMATTMMINKLMRDQMSIMEMINPLLELMLEIIPTI